MQRFLEGCQAGLADRSHAHRDRAGRVPAEVERRLAAAHRAHPTWGPKKLPAWLATAEPGTNWPAESTIGEVLRRAGLTQPRAQPKRPAPAAAPVARNALWTIDYAGQSAPGTGCGCAR